MAAVGASVPCREAPDARGWRTTRAIREFQKANGLARDGAITAGLYRALETAAEARLRRIGFLFCNETRYPVWGSDRTFCTKPTMFFIRGRTGCMERGYDRMSFKEIRVGEADAYVFRLR